MTTPTLARQAPRSRPSVDLLEGRLLLATTCHMPMPGVPSAMTEGATSKARPAGSSTPIVRAQATTTGVQTIQVTNRLHGTLYKGGNGFDSAGATPYSGPEYRVTGTGAS